MTVEQAIENFHDKTGFDLDQLLEDAVVFYDEQSQNIVQFFSGTTTSINSEAIDEMLRIRDALANVAQTFTVQSYNFYDIIYWELLDVVDDLLVKFRSLSNLRWYRTSRRNFDLSGQINVTHTLKRGQNLEGAVSNVANSDDRNNDWVDVAVSNDLTEEQYDGQGGQILQMSLINQQNVSTITSAVGAIENESIYGKDIDRNFAFADNDIVVLDNKETLTQSVSILAGLRRGDNPRFPDLGVQSDVGGNRNVNANLFPIVFRQVSRVFLTDDSLRSFSIKNITTIQDRIEYEYVVESRRREIITNSTTY